MKKPKIGLLPLYIELYDRLFPETRPGIEAFYSVIAGGFESRGVDVVTAAVCRLERECQEAVDYFQQSNVDAIVTLHLAYSPSLESANVLSRTGLPVLVLDTTQENAFGPGQDGSKTMYNHGIHGVQDMCNILIRNGKAFQFEAGHWEKSDVLDRAVSWIRAAGVAAFMRRSRVGIIGEPFEGMGDFVIPENDFRDSIGIEVVHGLPDRIRGCLGSVNETEIEREEARDRERFAANYASQEAYRRAVISGLAIRKWIESERLTGFTVNFLSAWRDSGLTCMPFLEASKAMARGTGYAGEGDILTAAFMGALACACQAVSFVEMYCPDWEGGSILLSHMGEMNPSLTSDKPLLMEVDFPYTDIGSAVFAYGRYRPGKAAIVNLAPGFAGRFKLIIASGRMLEVTGTDHMDKRVRGWFKIERPVADFLKQYSLAGGTHHAVLVYGGYETLISDFGRIMGWDIITIA